MLHAGVALRCGARFGCLFACPTGCFGAAEIGTADVSSGSGVVVRSKREQSSAALIDKQPTPAPRLSMKVSCLAYQPSLESAGRSAAKQPFGSAVGA